MGSITAIELGSDHCVLVRAARQRGVTEIRAVQAIAPAEWSPDERTLVSELRRIRRQCGLPRRSHVVAWDPADATSDPPRLDVLKAAGFHVQTTLRPTEALLELALERPRPPGSNAAAWLALSPLGAAFIIVHNSEVLFSEVFRWTIVGPFPGSQADLLRRYSLVAELAPHLRRGIERVRIRHGVETDVVVTCGTLPELRSLTMPVIEELDVEFETMDSMEGLDWRALTDQSPAAVRLACAATADLDRASSISFAFVARTSAVALLVAVAGLWSYGLWLDTSPAIPVVRSGMVAAGSPQPPPGSGPAGAGLSGPSQPSPIEMPAPLSSSRRRVLATTGRMDPVPDSSMGSSLPTLSGTLIGIDRRLALIDGAIVEVGDRLGTHQVVGIEPEFVILREPSGREIRLVFRRGTRIRDQP